MLDLIPTRFIIWLMLLGAVTIMFTMRSNLSIAILAMVESTANVANGTLTTSQLPNYGPRQNWTPYEQSLVLGAFYWSYTVASVPLGFLTDKYDWGRQNVGVALLLMALLTLATPLAVGHSLWLTLCSRVAMGLVSSGAMPAVNNLIAKWSPAAEKSRFICTLTGTDIGTVLAWSLCGLVIESSGWPWTFYGNGAIGVLFALLWFYVVSASPAQHPRMTVVELERIEKPFADSEQMQRTAPSATGRQWPPLLQICRSVPVWALLVAQFGHMCGIYVLVAGAPRFMYEVLGFDIARAGVVSSLLYVVRPIGGVLFAVLADMLLASGRMSRGAVRKGFVVFSHILAGLCFLLIGAVSRGPHAAWWCVACLLASSFVNGAASATNNQNPHDLAPNYVASLSAIMNATGTTCGFLAPMVIVWATREANTMDEWLVVFAIVGSVYIVSGCVFMLLGSVQQQWWNEPRTAVANP